MSSSPMMIAVPRASTAVAPHPFLQDGQLREFVASLHSSRGLEPSDYPYLSSVNSFDTGRRLSCPHACSRYPFQVLRNTSSTAFIFSLSAAAAAVDAKAASGSHVAENFIALSQTAPSGDADENGHRETEGRMRATSESARSGTWEDRGDSIRGRARTSRHDRKQSCGSTASRTPASAVVYAFVYKGKEVVKFPRKGPHEALAKMLPPLQLSGKAH